MCFICDQHCTIIKLYVCKRPLCLHLKIVCWKINLKSAVRSLLCLTAFSAFRLSRPAAEVRWWQGDTGHPCDRRETTAMMMLIVDHRVTLDTPVIEDKLLALPRLLLMMSDDRVTLDIPVIEDKLLPWCWSLMMMMLLTGWHWAPCDRRQAVAMMMLMGDDDGVDWWWWCCWQGDTGHPHEQEVDGPGRLLHLDPSGPYCWVRSGMKGLSKCLVIGHCWVRRLPDGAELSKRLYDVAQWLHDFAKWVVAYFSGRFPPSSFGSWSRGQPELQPDLVCRCARLFVGVLCSYSLWHLFVFSVLKAAWVWLTALRKGCCVIV